MRFDNTEEIEIVRLAISKDSDAFVYIAGKAKNKLFQTACVILGSKAEACDAVDETMYNAYRSIHKLREAQFFTTWITRILINQCNKMLKRRKYEVAYDEMPEMTIEYFDKLPINEAVAKLPDELKTIISLRYAYSRVLGHRFQDYWATVSRNIGPQNPEHWAKPAPKGCSSYLMNKITLLMN